MAATEPDSASGAAWAKRYTRTVAAEIRRVRKDRKYSAQDLADACQALGHKIHRSVLTNLENGHRDLITVPELMVIAAALKVSPMELVANWSQSSKVEILPEASVPTDRALRWLDGTLEDTALIRGEPVSVAYSPSGVLERIREHAQATQALQARFRELFEQRVGSEQDRQQKSFNLMLAARHFVRVRSELLEAGYEPPEVADDLEALMKGEWPPNFGPLVTDGWSA